MIINGSPVTVKPLPNDTELYEYFSCTCSDEDMEFWEKEVKRITECDDRKYVTSSLLMELEHVHGIYVDSVASDMWFGVALRGEGKHFYIQTDVFEYSLAAVILIMEALK